MNLTLQILLRILLLLITIKINCISPLSVQSTVTLRLQPDDGPGRSKRGACEKHLSCFEWKQKWTPIDQLLTPTGQ